MAPERSFVSSSATATEALAEHIGRALPAGAVVALDGELGTGKTTFVRGLCRGLAVDEEISSPTYTLMHEYRGRLPVYHFDAWMEGREQAFLEGGGAEWLHADGVSVIEWAERIREWLPEPRLEVRLAHLGPEQRGLRLTLVGRQPALAALLAALPEEIAQ